MKFESKFGVGEVCYYNYNPRRGMQDQIVKIVGVSFTIEPTVSYICEFVDSDGRINRIQLSEPMLEGDPKFDQEAGYPEEELE